MKYNHHMKYKQNQHLDKQIRCFDRKPSSDPSRNDDLDIDQVFVRISKELDQEHPLGCLAAHRAMTPLINLNP